MDTEIIERNRKRFNDIQNLSGQISSISADGIDGYATPNQVRQEIGRRLPIINAIINALEE